MYLEEQAKDGPIKLIDARKMYLDHFRNIGGDRSITAVHSIRLVHRLQSLLPDLVAFKSGRDILLSLKPEVGKILRGQAAHDVDALHLAKAVNTIRQAMARQKFYFSGTFEDGCQAKSVPEELLRLVSLLLTGQESECYSQTVLSIAQLCQFNFKSNRTSNTQSIYHHRHQETPLSVFLGLLIHSATRSRQLVEDLADLGLSITYDRILQISTSVADALIESFKIEKVVCPPSLRKYLFTVGAVDNVDHNPSSASSSTSFHGTGISLFQCKEFADDGEKRAPQPLSKARTGKVSPLPPSFANVLPVTLSPVTVVPANDGHDTSATSVSDAVPLAIPETVEISMTRSASELCHVSPTPATVIPLENSCTLSEAMETSITDPTLLEIPAELEESVMPESRDARILHGAHTIPTVQMNESSETIAHTTCLDISETSDFVTFPISQGNSQRQLTKHLDETELAKSHREDAEWMDKVIQRLRNDSLATENLTWSAHYANKQVEGSKLKQPGISVLLPLFHEAAHSLSMIKHAMGIVKDTTFYLNPSQIPVITADQPLFALAKQVQWTFPDDLGEDKFVVLFGGLHLEMNSLQLLGDWLKGSGWEHVMSEANIPGSRSLVNVTHVAKARHAHQITALALHELMHRAYLENAVVTDFEDWCERQKVSFPMFHYWSTVLELELDVLALVKSFREGNFLLYVSVLEKLLPWLFALDHQHYARWITVHLRDMKNLEKCHPDIFSEFLKGKFVVQRSHRAFSSIAVDQAHEMNNATVKGTGGAIGLTEDAAALRRWTIVSPEIARIIGEFPILMKSQESILHHDQTPSVQNTFLNEVESVIRVFESLGNPFLECSDALMRLDTKEVVSVEVAADIRNSYTIGMQGRNSFEVRIYDAERKQSVTAPIKKNGLLLFSTSAKYQLSLSKSKVVTSLKAECDLLGKIIRAKETREVDMNEVFAHENSASPPSLSRLGAMHHGQKSDLIECLIREVGDAAPNNTTTSTAQVKADCLILDGAALVNIVQPGPSTTFGEYAQRFLDYVSKISESFKRVDVVWDSYFPDSLKWATRHERGRGVRRKVLAGTPVPKQWQLFLRDEKNKEELFMLLAATLMNTRSNGDQIIVTTYNKEVKCNVQSAVLESPYLQTSSQEEADSRIFLHAADSIRSGFIDLVIKTVDTDVVVLAVSYYHQLHARFLWISFGCGKNHQYLPVHDIANSLGIQKSIALRGFHAFTGSDTTSTFWKKGKTSAWNAWSSYPDATVALEKMAQPMTKEDLEHITPIIERFTVLIYDRKSKETNVNSARKELYMQQGRSIDNIPPTQDALKHHTLRSVYQAGYVWGQCLEPNPSLPSPDEWGWKKSETNQHYVPLWTSIPEVSAACQSLIKCTCKGQTCTRCKCFKAGLPCSPLCTCQCKKQ
jgi:hypothetical protein